MPVISIIVPVYNVEKYLDKCVKSILAQTFKDFELILVDDGSKDNSGKMCDEYAKTDNRIKVIHKENGGLSSARNAGIDIASGDFFGFVDSDDYIEEDMYEMLYNNLIRENADMSICGRYHCYNGKPLRIEKEKYAVYDTEEALRSLCNEKIGAAAWDKLYKRKLFEKIRYPLNKTAEDAFVIVELLLKCQTIVMTTKQKYYWYHHEDSITGRRLIENCLNAMEAEKKNYELICSNYQNLRNEAVQRLCHSYFYALDGLMLNNSGKYPDKENEIVKEIRGYTAIILFKSGFSIKRKISVAVLFFSKFLYKKMLVFQRKYNTPFNS